MKIIITAFASVQATLLLTYCLGMLHAPLGFVLFPLELLCVLGGIVLFCIASIYIMLDRDDDSGDDDCDL